MKDQSFVELMDEACEMLQDMTEEQREFAYAIAKLDDEARSALILAYRKLYDKDEE